MIEFNHFLENLNATVNKASKLKKLFALSSAEVLINTISNLDTSKKGYINIQDLCKNCPESIQYWSTKFQKRISYSILASYLQAIQCNSSIIQEMRREICQTDIVEYAQYQYLINKYKEKVLTNIAVYINRCQHSGNIKYQQFEQYCHSQKLRVNPKILFNEVCGSQEEIQLYCRPANQQVFKDITVDETKRKVDIMNMRLQRLSERIFKFGQQWF